MKFEEAYKKMKKEKKKIKLPDWNNIYWYIHNSRVRINNNGKIYNLGDYINFSLKYLVRTDWQVIE